MSPIAQGNNNAPALYVGNDPVQRIYKGNQQVWPSSPPPEPGSITFEVYSQHGTGQAFPYGERGDAATSGTNRQVLPNSTLEMVQYTGLGLMIENVQGTRYQTPMSVADYRKLSFVIDFGERYDAQFLEHEYLPQNFTTLAPDGPTMGRYPMWTAGHIMRGCNMSGTEVLTKDYDSGQGLPVGMMDIPVTVTVSDGVNTGSMSFTVRLSNWFLYYLDLTKTTYGVNAYRGGLTDIFETSERGSPLDSEIRRGIVYYAQDGDFRGAEFGPGIWHAHVPLGKLVSDTNGGRNSFTKGTTEKAEEGWTLINTANATQILQQPDGRWLACDADGTPNIRPDFPWKNNKAETLCALLKAGPGNVWTTESGLDTEGLIPGANGLLMSWGGGGARATFSGEGLRGWNDASGVFYYGDSRGRFRGLSIRHIDFHLSDYSVADETWREWWNIIPYTNKQTPGPSADFIPPKMLRYDSATGTLSPGDIITGSGTGTTARVLELRSAGEFSWFRYEILSGPGFTSSEVITTPGGFSADVAAVDIEDDTGNFGRGGEKLRNGDGSVWTRIVHDFDNGDGTGCLYTFQVLDQEDLDGMTGNPTAFSNGETLIAQDSAVTVDVNLSGVDPYGNAARQNRTKKAIPGFWGASAAPYNNPSFIGLYLDDCILRGGKTVFGNAGSWVFRSDTVAYDFWDFGHIGDTRTLFDSGFVIVQPASFTGNPFKDTGAVNSDQKRIWNATKNRNPTVPTANGIAHTVHRHEAPQTWARYKSGCHWYGGHCNATDNNDPFLSDYGKGTHQLLFRMQGDAVANMSNICQYGCFDSGGLVIAVAADKKPITRYPFWWLYDLHNMRGAGYTAAIGSISLSKVGFRDCQMGWPTDVTLDETRDGKIGDVMVKFNDFDDRVVLGDPASEATFDDINDLPDTQPATTFERCNFFIGAAGIRQTETVEFNVVHRERTITYTDCTVEILEPDSTPGQLALPPGNVDPIP